MATITLYAGKVNQMSNLINHAKKSVEDYKSELSLLNLKLCSIDSSVCNLDDVISSINSSTQTQANKIEALDTLNKDVEGFISDVVTIDHNAADAINQRKNDFYDKYEYLKPDIENEKGWLEKAWDSACEWCKEHWKELLITVAIVIGAVLLIAAVIASGGLALVPLLTALGLSASAAVSISTIVATVAVISTIGSSILNIIDTWRDIDSPLFKTIQKVLNWTSVISNGVYLIGYIYNGINGISNADLIDFNNNRLVNVSRWGRPDLYPGDWVMKGDNTFWNYVRSGKFQKGFGNEFAPFSAGSTFLVPNGSLKWPVGNDFFDRGIWSIIKWLLGQRRYLP